MNEQIEQVIDQCGLNQFTNAMWERLDEKRKAGEFGWYNTDTPAKLTQRLYNNLNEGASGVDLIDAANLLMMLWNNHYEITNLE